MLAQLLRVAPEYPRIEESTIERNLGPAKAFAEANGFETGSVEDRYVLGRVKMLFTIYQPEATKLDGREGDHTPWLESMRGELFHAHGFWDNYRRLLETRIRADTPLRRLDETTDQILGSLENPNQEGQWDRRGLVMGHVQSGKTNNYCGLIAKAADAGYKLIIVLAGTFNNLRAQTQYRIDEALVGRDTTSGPTSTKAIGVGLEAESKPIISLTSATETGDFKAATAAAVGFDFGAINAPTVFVIKKNVTVLKNLHEWILAHAPIPEGHERVAGIPLLLIDDEADSASINTANTAKDAEVDPTKTNMWIRRILNTFDQTGFVGYTATPFANIFVDEQADDPDVGEDLFPRSFIFSLEAPDNWVGPEQVFGISTDEYADDSPQWPVTSEVLDNEDWLPPKHKKDLVVQPDLFPTSLDEAIRAFVLSCAARRTRGQLKDHKSMLVHVTAFVNTQNQVREQVGDHLWNLKNAILYNYDSQIRRQLNEIWDRDFLSASRILQAHGEPPPVQEYSEIEAELVNAVSAITVKTINGSSADCLDYSAHTGNGLSTIVIGGAKLSRGLTLEGLSVSYYLRATRMYDTLMQMGRWFGYRPGYLDLCRVYTTPEIMQWYRNISVATRELLDDFNQMRLEGATPADFGLKVRNSPGMLVTAQAKMRNGVKRQVSFSQTRPETTTYEIAENRRAESLECLEALITGLDPEAAGPGENQGDYSWHDVPSETVRTYLASLSGKRLYDHSRSAIPGYLHDYIRQRNRDNGLVKWTILLKGNSQDTEPFTISGLAVGRSTRRHNGSANATTYSVKGLIGSKDEAFDLTEEQLRDVEAAAKREGKLPHGRAFRAKRPTERGLLILYVLRGEGIENGGHVPDGSPFVGYCLSLPRDPHGTTIEYTVNNIYDQQELFEE